MPGGQLTVEVPAPRADTGSGPSGAHGAANRRITINRDGCVNPSLIESFLRELRRTTDNVVNQRTNDLQNAPAQELGARCVDYVGSTLLPAWHIRGQVIDFCATQASQIRASLQLGGDESHVPAAVDPTVNPYVTVEEQERHRARLGDVMKMENWVANQREIERILQRTTLARVNSVCGQLDEFASQVQALTDRRNN
ncbi:ACR189Cp [Eremothecium gossypii ATCC 10895]|uniref:ACR189Cp n=1 Tax=Eremothecium gossypii (strain ATCC 10895 / CBS 109.51 / FGSC 9923 / NRRL Y-1056) TaxID=284811 RepID=Q75BT2_EREGS|nr:ACR189Cp [Eremothecium gossypii ATCC 10895]AAS51415.1 ACR189Cp [Eremothecium gossypii ATCC 10895]AEY95706.1 FACR189Cp [Eremothecium gossypii FDAG1]